MQKVYENGVLVGRYGSSFGPDGKPRKVFIPRRDEDIAADMAKPRFVFVAAEDESVDPEYQLLRADGTKTDIAIQDCRSYGGGFAITRVGEDSITFIGGERTLAKAKTVALAAANL